MTAQEARLHLRYSGWASRKVMEAAGKLTPEQQTHPMGVSHQSILGTLGHIYLADRIWCSRVIDPSLPRLTESSPELLQNDWPQIQAKWESWADALEDSGLNGAATYQAMDGASYRTPVWQVVLHVVNHATLHRGQVVGMLRQLGTKPPVTDLIYYYRELAAAATTP